jgi:hypothetical protein
MVNFTPTLVSANTRDVFQTYVRHNVGADVVLSGKDMQVPDDPSLAEPTAN